MIEAFKERQDRRDVHRHHQGSRRGLRFRAGDDRPADDVPGAGVLDHQEHSRHRSGRRAHRRAGAERQGEHLEKIIKNATMLRVPVETTKPATDLIASGQADAFSHVVPMLANAQPALPGSRILPGSYYDVPIAIGYPKGSPRRWSNTPRPSSPT
jgi:hypothetical protein